MRGVRIVISHAYSTENKGDAALLSVLIQDIRRQYGTDCSIDILTIDSADMGGTFEGVKLREAFMFYALSRPKSKLGKLFYALGMTTYTRLWAWVKRYLKADLPLPHEWRKTTELYQRADLIITVGGGYFRSSADPVTFVNLLLMLHPLHFATLLGKPTCLYTMSVGPFYRPIEKSLTARAFRKLPLILIRENTSLELLEAMDVTENVRRSVDSGFLFTGKKSAELRKTLELKKTDILVGVTARKWLNAEGQAAYETALAQTIDAIITKHKVQVVFIPQVTSVSNNDDDRKVSRSVVSRMKQTQSVHVMEDDYDHYDVKAMYDELDYIIGTRFHSVIFSLTSRVPAIAIEYEHKTSGIMRDLNLSEWTVKIEDVKPEVLTKKFDALTKHHDQYVLQLDDVLPGYVADATHAIELVDEAYRAYLAR